MTAAAGAGGPSAVVLLVAGGAGMIDGLGAGVVLHRAIPGSINTCISDRTTDAAKSHQFTPLTRDNAHELHLARLRLTVGSQVSSSDQRWWRCWWCANCRLPGACVRDQPTTALVRSVSKSGELVRKGGTLILLGGPCAVAMVPKRDAYVGGSRAAGRVYVTHQPVSWSAMYVVLSAPCIACGALALNAAI